MEPVKSVETVGNTEGCAVATAQPVRLHSDYDTEEGRTQALTDIVVAEEVSLDAAVQAENDLVIRTRQQAEEWQGALFYQDSAQDVESLSPKRKIDGGILFLSSTPHSDRIPERWVVPRKIHVSRILSRTTLNFCKAEFVREKVYIDIGSILGKVMCIVPRGVQVIYKGAGLLGGYQKNGKSSMGSSFVKKPTIIIRGVHVLAKVVVKVNEEYSVRTAIVFE